MGLFTEIREMRAQAKARKERQAKFAEARFAHLCRFVKNTPGYTRTIHPARVYEGAVVYINGEGPYQVNDMYQSPGRPMRSFYDEGGQFRQFNVGISYPDQVVLWRAKDGTRYRNPSQLKR